MLNDFEQFVLDRPEDSWDYKALSCNPRVTKNLVKITRDRDWYPRYLFKNDSVFLDAIKLFPGYHWRSEVKFSKDPRVTWEIVQKNPSIKWDYSQLSGNPNINMEIVKANPDKPWNFWFLSENPNITWYIVKSNPDLPWKYENLSKNKNITWENVRDSILQNWDFNALSSNENMSIEFIKANPDKKWNYYYIAHNRFSQPYKIKQKLAAKIIQRNCLRWLNKPVTRDGKLGITVRLGLKELGKLDEAPLRPRS